MTTPRRGEVWLVDFGTPVGHEQGFRRPAAVVSADNLNRSRAGLVFVVPMTRTRRQLPTHVEIRPGTSGLSEISYAKAEDLKSISIDRLLQRFGQISHPELHRLETVIRRLLAL